MTDMLVSSPNESDRRDTAGRLSSVFGEALSLPLDRVHRDLVPTDVDGWDSVGHVMLIAAIEEEFSIQFEVDEIMEFTGFQSILSAVHRKMASA